MDFPLRSNLPGGFHLDSACVASPTRGHQPQPELKQSQRQYPTLTSKSVISANLQYGAAWGVAFLQVLKQLNGATPTRQSVVAAMLTQNGFATPALVKLDYTSGNHQGLNGGYVIKISSKTDTVVADKQIYTTGDGPLATSPLVKVTGKVAPIPTWLK